MASAAPATGRLRSAGFALRSPRSWFFAARRVSHAYATSDRCRRHRIDGDVAIETRPVCRDPRDAKDTLTTLRAPLDRRVETGHAVQQPRFSDKTYRAYEFHRVPRVCCPKRRATAAVSGLIRAPAQHTKHL